LLDRRVIVIAKGVGRLGNRLLLFSHFIGAAIEHDLLIINPAFGLYAHHFPATAHDPLCRFPRARRLPVPPYARQALFSATRAGAEHLHRLQLSGRDVGLIRLDRREYLDLNGESFLGVLARHRIVVVQDWHFRNTENVVRHGDAIRSFLTPAELTLERARAPLHQAREAGQLVVGVHVRRTDYRDAFGGRLYYSHAQYRRIMSHLEAELGEHEVKFFVCSDEPVPQEAFSGLDVVSGGSHAIVDLFGLAACDLLIGPPSTFSRWASFYGDVPLYVISDPDDRPTREAFRVDTGLGFGRGEREWTDPAKVQAKRPNQDRTSGTTLNRH
jgi:hypothetical protein